METVLILFLLMMSQNGQWKQSLEEFLKFYRENRELIQMVTGAARTASGATTAEEQQKSRPEEVGSWSVLEDFLRRSAV